MKQRNVFIWFFVLVITNRVSGNVRLPAILSSDMVLQQQSDVRIWGWANPYEKVTVITSWDNATYSATGSGNARWEVVVHAPAAGGPYTISVNNIVLNNVLIGEVWVCSGQSNMEWPVKHGLKELAYHSQIRLFHVPKATAGSPQERGEGKWAVCDSNSLPDFSAVAYFFGKKLNSSLNVPVGLISASWGGTAAEVWTPDSIVVNDPALNKAAATILPSGMCPRLPGVAYNAMIAPITNFAIAGAIWYQGENNTENAGTYDLLLTFMIDAWRLAWKKEFPFYYVQIAPFHYRIQNTGALLREAQLKVMQHAKTGMVVITDLVTDTNNVHPGNKHDVGLRLANWALADTYHKEGIVYKSPVYKESFVRKDKMIIVLDHVPQGLLVKGKEITELVIAGDDKVFYPGKASISKNTITVWSKQVPHPVAVRFGFRDAAMGNLFSKEGLPVAPFRTDNWPVETK